MMRQTFADEIINAGLVDEDYVNVRNGVVFKIPDVTNENKTFLDNTHPSLPVFDCLFMEYQALDNWYCVLFNKPELNDDVLSEYPFFQAMLFFRLAENKYLQSQFYTGLLYDTDGTIKGIERTQVPTQWQHNQYSFIIDETIDYEEFEQPMITYAIYWLSELHKGRDIELVTPSRQVSRQVERKTGKKPSPYFEIKVDPTKPQKRYTSTQKTGRSKNAHIVRGNFATYTEDAPLLGKYTGTFWRPAHARGVTDGDKPEPKNYRIVLNEIKTVQP